MVANYLILSVILIGLLVLIFSKKKLEKVLYKYLLFYLSANFIYESIAFYLSKQSKSNYEVYNLEMITEVTFFLFLYKKIALSKYAVAALNFAISLFVSFSIINLAFLQSIEMFNTNTYTLGSFLLVFACTNYLYTSILKDEVRNPIFSLTFWISLGVLFCYLGNFLFLSNVNHLFSIDEGMALRVQIISISVNTLLYLLIAVGILCSKQI
ncbi:MAG: hypothetical protein ACTHMM_01235 [Agriterribacter sp.]